MFFRANSDSFLTLINGFAVSFQKQYFLSAATAWLCALIRFGISLYFAEKDFAFDSCPSNQLRKGVEVAQKVLKCNQKLD